MASEPPARIDFTATHIFSALGFFVALCALAGALVHNQITTLKEDVILARNIADRRIDTLAGEIQRRELELKSDIKTLREELLERRQQFPTQFQFQEFKSSIDDRWRTQADINSRTIEAYLSVKAWEAWRMERDRLISHMEERLRDLEKKKP